MLRLDQVPKEAIEASAVMLSNGKTTAQAIAAAINAWPGMEIEMVFVEEDYLILPVPNEPRDG